MTEEMLDKLNGDGTGTCFIRKPHGWRCTRGWHVIGPCAVVPRWWNLRGRIALWCARQAGRFE